MNRLIPGKTKVSIELFRGVTIGDIIVCAIAFAMLLLVFISNMPGKLWICIGIAAIAAFLLFRMDGQANYIYLLHILTYFGYNRHFERFTDDQLLAERFEKGEALFEVETDKVVNQVEAERGGVVRQLIAEEGDEVAPGDVIALIED